MKKHIQTDFKKFSITENNDIDDIEDIEDIKDDLTHAFINIPSREYDVISTSSYNAIARNHEDRNSTRDLDELLRILNDDFDITNDMIETLFTSAIGKDFIADYDNDNVPFNLCGIYDYFFYKFSNGETQLSGYDPSDLEISSKFDEVIIKYAYGYTNTMYGQLLINQYFGDDKSFCVSAAMGLMDILGGNENTEGLGGDFYDSFVQNGPLQELTLDNEDAIITVKSDIIRDYDFDDCLRACGVPLNDNNITNGYSEFIGSDTLKIYFK